MAQDLNLRLRLPPSPAPCDPSPLKHKMPTTMDRRRGSTKANAAHLLDPHDIKSFSSYHTKPLPEDPQLLLSVFWKTLFLPACPGWWMKALEHPIKPAVSPLWYFITCLVYMSQLIICVCHLGGWLPTCRSPSLGWEIWLPTVLMFLFSLGHAQILACTTCTAVRRELHDAESSSDSDDAETEEGHEDGHEEDPDFAHSLRGSTVNCALWGPNGERRKRHMTLGDLRQSLVVKMNDSMPDPLYQRLATLSALVIPLLPICYSILALEFDEARAASPVTCSTPLSWLDLLYVAQDAVANALHAVWNTGGHCIALQLTSAAATLLLTIPTFQQLAAAEVTFSRRVIYARCFKAMTSSQKAQRLGLPYFSLKATENIQFWLALRGGRPWLARQQHQRTADVVGTLTFLATCLLMLTMLYEYFVTGLGRFPFSLLHWEMLAWGIFLSAYLLRFLICGSRLNAKYGGISVLLTEQINVHLRIMENTECGSLTKAKLQRLQASNNVLKLSTKLLKELSKPSKISGFAMNPMLYHVVRIVLLSALSACLSDTLGFNLRLWTLTKMK
eukprot:GGOE01049797.1.p1 GENE.GGOE01049797.1~~GGOE01049797.1.p1  ORF type:complete len:559 (-),score=164.70 GGOE01049797.1:199-1875(-)